jgi:Putative peptidoglycan binding domain/D-alanyl-D-alanine carboxypeptidase
MIKSEIKSLQFFLIGKGFLKGSADGDFGPVTKEAVKRFQSANGLLADGIVGNRTLAVAALQGYRPAEFPQRPSFNSLTTAEKIKLFGRIKFEASHSLTDKDAIIIKGDWEEKNIVLIDIPQLAKIKGSPRVACHKLVAHQFIGLFNEIEEKNLLHLIKTWDGLFYPRFIRGYYGVLSTHSWGIAFDINVEWNGLGANPAFIGEVGSVRELVEIALKWGFYWGGWFSRNDGQHFEVYKILPL